MSPFSAETILALTLSGSKGETANELRKALHLPENKSRVENDIKTLLPQFKSNNFYTLESANKVYLKKNFHPHNEFKNSGDLIYGAETESIDFFPNTVQAAKSINNWVEKHTSNKIKNLVDANDFDEFTRAVLVNALYFKANWSNPFLLAATSKQKFYKKENQVVEVDTLRHFEQYFNYYECPHLKARFLELPFKGDEATMVVVLPNAKDGLGALETQLDQVFAPQHQLQREFLDVGLPKFKVESSVDFKEILEGVSLVNLVCVVSEGCLNLKLGVKKLFEEKVADLSGVAGEPGDLFVKKVAQKSFVEVSEEGVEAAAATYVRKYFFDLVEDIFFENLFLVVAVPEMAHFERPKQFIADHPFIFYIKIKDVIIFAGRVTDPSKQ